MHVEGYWRTTEGEKSPLPWPVAGVLTTSQIEGILTKLRFVESRAKVDAFKGSSTSRLTGELNGSREYTYKEWCWPSGLTHYIKHGVKPTDKFLHFLDVETKALTPSCKPAVHNGSHANLQHRRKFK